MPEIDPELWILVHGGVPECLRQVPCGNIPEPVWEHLLYRPIRERSPLFREVPGGGPFEHVVDAIFRWCSRLEEVSRPERRLPDAPWEALVEFGEGKGAATWLGDDLLPRTPRGEPKAVFSGPADWVIGLKYAIQIALAQGPKEWAISYVPNNGSDYRDIVTLTSDGKGSIRVEVEVWNGPEPDSFAEASAHTHFTTNLDALATLINKTSEQAWRRAG